MLRKLHNASEISLQTSLFDLAWFKFFETFPIKLTIPAIPDVRPITALEGSKNPPKCTILDGGHSDNFILADELFATAIQSLKTCPSVNKLCKKLFSLLESPITVDEGFNVTSVSFFISDFNG